MTFAVGLASKSDRQRVESGVNAILDREQVGLGTALAFARNGSEWSVRDGKAIGCAQASGADTSWTSFEVRVLAVKCWFALVVRTHKAMLWPKVIPQVLPVASLLGIALAIALFIALMTLPAVSAANIFLQDLREDLDAPPRALQSIGVLRKADDPEGWGTAFLVGKCHILTAFHVAFPNHSAPGFIPSSGLISIFQVGKQAGMQREEFLDSSRAHPVEWGEFHTRDFSGLAGDWAILRLDHCLGQRYGWIRIDKRVSVKTMSEGPVGIEHLATGEIVSMASFPADRSKDRGISFEAGCRVRSIISPHLGAMDCALIAGASGASVLIKSEGGVHADGDYSLVGIAIRRFTPVDEVLPEYSVGHANILVLKQAFAAAVKRHTEEVAEWPSAESPLVGAPFKAPVVPDTVPADEVPAVDVAPVAKLSAG